MLSSTTAAKPTFTAPSSASTLTFSLVVRDGKADSAAVTTTVNRTDASADKLNNAVVFLSTASMSGRTYAQLMADSTVTKLYLGATPGAVTSLPTNTVARYVKVQSPATSAGVISLAEVTVTGTQPN